MANINISNGSTYVVGVTDPTWVGADGDTIVISNESEVLIDADQYVPTNKWGAVTCSTIGTLRIKNAGANGRILVFEMNAITNDIRMERRAELRVEGDFLEVATGDGTAGQTIDFSSIGTNNVSLDEVSCIWIEETPNGKKWPFLSLGDPSIDVLNMPLAGVSGSEGTGANGFGGAGASSDWAVGRNFNFNRTTKVATFGDGTNGLVIPNGCKAYISNIQITGTFNSSFSSRSTFDFSPEGSAFLKNVDFTNSFYAQFRQTSRLDLDYVSLPQRTYMRDNYGKVSFDNVASFIDTRRTLLTYPMFIYETPQGLNTTWNNFYIDLSLRGITSSRYGLNIYLDDCVQFENVWLNCIDKDSADYTGLITQAKNLTLKNVYQVDYIVITNSSNCELLNWKFRGSSFAPQFTALDTSYRSYGLRFSGVTNKMKLINYEHVNGSTPPGYFIDVALTCSEIEIYNAKSYGDSVSVPQWGVQGLRNYGDNVIVKNCEFNGGFSSYFVSNDIDASGCTYENIYGNVGERSNLGLGNIIWNMVDSGINIDILNGTPSNMGLTLTRSAETNTGTAPNITYAGFLRLDGGPPIDNEYYYEVGGGAYVASGDTYIPNIGSYVAMGNKVPLKGFKGFIDTPSGSRLYGSGLTLPEVTISYKISLADNPLPSDWTIIDTTIEGGSSNFNCYAQLQSAFNAIKGANYDSNKGINFALKCENINDPNPARYLLAVNILCEIDNDYKANDATITLSGGDESSKYEIVRASDNVVLYTFIGQGTHEFYLANNYLTEVYFKRYRDVGGSYDLLLNTQYTSQPLIYGDNGEVFLYAGAEVQVASNDVKAIWEYNNRTLTAGGFTDEDRAKALTTGKFLALK